MMPLYDELRLFLRNVNADAVEMGGRSIEGPVVEVRRMEFVRRLERQMVRLRRLTTIAAIMYVVLFAIVIAWLLSRGKFGSPSALPVAALTLSLGIIASVQKLWRQSAVIEALVAILPEVDPKEAVKVVQALYFREAREPKGSTSATK